MRFELRRSDLLPVAHQRSLNIGALEPCSQIRRAAGQQALRYIKLWLLGDPLGRAVRWRHRTTVPKDLHPVSRSSLPVLCEADSSSPRPGPSRPLGRAAYSFVDPRPSPDLPPGHL